VVNFGFAKQSPKINWRKNEFEKVKTIGNSKMVRNPTSTKKKFPDGVENNRYMIY